VEILFAQFLRGCLFYGIVLQWFPVESSSTSHMLSQLSKTIKMALKSTEEERAILRARSAVQRFPVVEWRQRMEDFHRRSIQMSRGMAGSNAWRTSDCEVEPTPVIAGLETEDWDPVHQPDPMQPDWDARSVASDNSRFQTPATLHSPATPATPGQWSQSTLAPEQQHLAAPPRITIDDHGRRASFSTDVSENEDYFSRTTRPSMDTTHLDPNPPAGGYENFLSRVNKQIAKERKHVPDPFLDVQSAAPSKPFGQHSRVQSMESIASIVDEKANSPLNKAIESVRQSLKDYSVVIVFC
jgi:alpha-1,3-glucan synthase